MQKHSTLHLKETLPKISLFKRYQNLSIIPDRTKSTAESRTAGLNSNLTPIDLQEQIKTNEHFRKVAFKDNLNTLELPAFQSLPASFHPSKTCTNFKHTRGTGNEYNNQLGSFSSTKGFETIFSDLNEDLALFKKKTTSISISGSKVKQEDKKLWRHGIDVTATDHHREAGLKPNTAFLKTKSKRENNIVNIKLDAAFLTKASLSPKVDNEIYRNCIIVRRNGIELVQAQTQADDSINKVKKNSNFRQTGQKNNLKTEEFHERILDGELNGGHLASTFKIKMRNNNKDENTLNGSKNSYLNIKPVIDNQQKIESLRIKVIGEEKAAEAVDTADSWTRTSLINIRLKSHSLKNALGRDTAMDESQKAIRLNSDLEKMGKRFSESSESSKLIGIHYKGQLLEINKSAEVKSASVNCSNKVSNELNIFKEHERLNNRLRLSSNPSEELSKNKSFDQNSSNFIEKASQFKKQKNLETGTEKSGRQTAREESKVLLEKKLRNQYKNEDIVEGWSFRSSPDIFNSNHDLEYEEMKNNQDKFDEFS